MTITSNTSIVAPAVVLDFATRGAAIVSKRAERAARKAARAAKNGEALPVQTTPVTIAARQGTVVRFAEWVAAHPRVKLADKTASEPHISVLSDNSPHLRPHVAQPAPARPAATNVVKPTFGGKKHISVLCDNSPHLRPNLPAPATAASAEPEAVVDEKLLIAKPDSMRLAGSLLLTASRR
jgi:hypothetical protein